MNDQTQMPATMPDGAASSAEGANLTGVLGAWKTIETAPRGNNSAFLGWDGESIEKTWEGWDEDGYPVYVYADYISWGPTHWMPLPEAPNALHKGLERSDSPAAGVLNAIVRGNL